MHYTCDIRLKAKAKDFPLRCTEVMLKECEAEGTTLVPFRLNRLAGPSALNLTGAAMETARWSACMSRGEAL